MKLLVKLGLLLQVLGRVVVQHLVELLSLVFVQPGRARSGEKSEERNMRKSNVALRLQTSLLEEAKRVAESEGVALNQLINVAVAEKLSALRTEEYFRERSRRADIPKAKRILKGPGRRKPPVAGDQL